MIVRDWLLNATWQLKAVGIESAHLDAELLLSFVTRLDRAKLLAYPEQALDKAQLNRLARLLTRRLHREPLAYILHEKEFYGRIFYVNKHVLIPRAESEAFISQLRSLTLTSGTQLIDIGTGSGCLAITAALEFPDLRVEGWDIDTKTLSVARKNARNLDAKVRFKHRDLRKSVSRKTADVVIANLPYVDPDWQHSPETAYEPAVALFAEDHGLSLIKDLLTDSPLKKRGYLLLEADTRQHQELVTEATRHAFTLLGQEGLILTFQLT